MGKLTGHTQEVCGLGIESLSFSSPHALSLTFFVSSSGYFLLLSVWSKDGRTLASGGNDNCVQLWDWQVGDLTKQRQGIRPVIHMSAIEHYYHYSGPGDADEHDHSSPVCRQGSVLVSLAKQCSCYCRLDFLHLGFSCLSP